MLWIILAGDDLGANSQSGTNGNLGHDDDGDDGDDDLGDDDD